MVMIITMIEMPIHVTIVLERVAIANYIRCNVSMILFENTVTFPYYPSNLSSTLSTAARISSSKIDESNSASKHRNIIMVIIRFSAYASSLYK